MMEGMSHGLPGWQSMCTLCVSLTSDLVKFSKLIMFALDPFVHTLSNELSLFCQLGLGEDNMCGMRDKLMSSITAQQAKLDLEVVPKEKRLEIGKYNERLNPEKIQRESIFQVILDALALTSCYSIQDRQKEEIQIHYGNLQIYLQDLPTCTWNFPALINKSLSGKTTGLDKLRLSRAQILWVSTEAPTGKSKRVKRPTKKSTETPARGVVIIETPKMSLTKKKEKVDVTRDETKTTDKVEGDDDEEMDFTTSQLYDEVDIRLNEPVDTDEGFVQEVGTDAAMTNVQQGNENPKILQVIEDAHVTLSTVLQKTEVSVTSFSHSSNLAAKFLNFLDIPHSDAEIVSPMDVHVQHEVPNQQTPTLLTTFFYTYGKVYLLKRSRKDKDKDKDDDLFAGSDRGLKKRKTSKDAEPAKVGGVGNKMHKAFPLPGESYHWQYKFPLPVKVVPTARRLEMPLSGVCTAIEEMMKKLPFKDRWQPTPTVKSTSAEGDRPAERPTTNKAEFVKATERPTTDKVETAKKPAVRYAKMRRVQRETTRSQNHAYKSPSHRSYGAPMRPSHGPAGHRPHGPPMRPMRSNMNGVKRTSAVRPQYRAPWVPTVNRNFPPVNRKLPSGNSNVSTVCCCCSRHVNTARPKAVINRRNKVKDVQASAC
uniref:Reverse transcriptase domain-containing protein n=1 Tax=Tanacetum cinerariifolium TaxID=118510 RepID=A0A6L2KX35_TANCI|nr:hypothetical protein [Tanacetum cinerariifolium]